MAVKHLQTRVNEEDFKSIKKAAIDAGLTLEDFLKKAAIKETEKGKEGTPADQVDSKTNP